MRQFEHVILTRFNVQVNYSNARVGINPDWLSHRFDLFDKFCYPSMQAQLNQNFKWIVYFDSQTPDKFKIKIEEYTKWANFIPVYLNLEFSSQINRETVLRHLENETEYLITTRLDNDDAVSKNFVEVIQSNFSFQDFEFINLTNGYVWNNQKLYLFKYKSNPFISLVEKVNGKLASGIKTVYCADHTQLSSVGNIKQVDSMPSWMQVVHEKNVSNRIRGIRQPISKLGHDFLIPSELIPPHESILSYWVDRSLSLIRSPIESFVIRLPKNIRINLKRLLAISK